MATRAEKQREQAQRRGRTAKAEKRGAAKKSRREKFGSAHSMKRAGKKASYALESPSKEGHASRKSTRGSANRAKPDTNFNLREEMTKGSPASRYRKARVKTARVRGGATAGRAGTR